jgi:hypothetical protein
MGISAFNFQLASGLISQSSTEVKPIQLIIVEGDISLIRPDKWDRSLASRQYKLLSLIPMDLK